MVRWLIMDAGCSANGRTLGYIVIMMNQKINQPKTRLESKSWPPQGHGQGKHPIIYADQASQTTLEMFFSLNSRLISSFKA